MASETAEHSGQPTQAVGALNSRVDEVAGSTLKALNVVLGRALENNKHVLDQKEPAEGPVQDSEFGMILLMGRKWLRKLDKLEGTLANEDNVADISLELLRRTSERILGLRFAEEDKREDNKQVYFSGSPYATIVGKIPKSYDNVDAAALILSFLCVVSEEYWETIASQPHGFGEAVPAALGKTLLEATVYLIQEGIGYLTRCADIDSETELCLGWTCRPGFTIKEGQERDRLFFTWTVSETIEDLKEWEGMKKLQQFSAEVAQTIENGINDLLRLRDEAAQSCDHEFSNLLQVRGKRKDVRELMKTNDVDTIREYVQNVYHLSQFGAILSLSPKLLSLEKIDNICDALDYIVNRQIIGSTLDAVPKAENPKLFRSLTREYQIGDIGIGYYDDAYYPLVVRAISALLYRSIDTLSTAPNVTKQQIRTLLDKNEKNLLSHVENLTDRHPKKLEEGDEFLWSFARDSEYVFYATERTIFALMHYGDFLEAAHKFRTSMEEGPPKEIEEAVRQVLANKFVELFEPCAKEIAKQMSGRYEGSGPRIAELDQLAPWVRNVFGAWLQKLIGEFVRTKIDQQVDKVLANWLFVVNRVEKLPRPLSRGKKSLADKHLKSLHDAYDRVLKLDGIGPKLREITHQEQKDELKSAVFEYLFDYFLSAQCDSRSWNWESMEKRNELLSFVKSAKKAYVDYNSASD